MKAKSKATGGKPTSYQDKWPAELIKFFSVEPYRVIKSGGEERERPSDFPTFAGFAVSIGVHRATLLNWCKAYPEFRDAYARAKDYQERHLVVNGLRGNFATSFAIFTAKNVLGWRGERDDENRTESESRNGREFVEQLKEMLNARRDEKKA